MLLAGADQVQGRLGDEHVAVLDQRPHIPVEEREQQGPDVGTVHIRIGHDDDLVVPGLGDVEFVTDAASEGRDHGPDFLAVQHLVQTGFFHVQDLAPQRQDGLEVPVTALLGTAPLRNPPSTR